LIIGSGNIVHNLGLIDFRNIDAQPYKWAVEFDEIVKSNLINKNHKELVNFKKWANMLPWQFQRLTIFANDLCDRIAGEG